MKNLVLCGGSGAHAGLAYVRLHLLGHAVGFFQGALADLPDIYLIDQDAGDTPDNQTAWSALCRLIQDHPLSAIWNSGKGRSKPIIKTVSPLPVGPAGMLLRSTTIDSAFPSSDLKQALFSERQRRLNYSAGMLGSPALGASVFHLKYCDKGEDGRNRDAIFEALMNARRPTAVVGSGIGGTGAAVGPTFALLAAEQNKVAAIMLHQWFRFPETGQSAEDIARGRARNQLMRENASSAMAFYGTKLAGKVASLPIGVPETAIVERKFTGDFQQAKREAYIHVVAAAGIAAHFEDRLPVGLNSIGASNPARITADFKIAGGPIQLLGDRAAMYQLLLSLVVNIYRENYSTLTPAIRKLPNGVSAAEIASLLESEANIYQEQLNWFNSVTGLSVRRALPPLKLANFGERVKRIPIPIADNASTFAANLKTWLAAWAIDLTSDSAPQIERGAAGHYWPGKVDEGHNRPTVGAGEVDHIPDDSRLAVLRSFIRTDHLSANGWPHRSAAVDFFRYRLEHATPHGSSAVPNNPGDPYTLALRQLEMLIIGIMQDVLEIAHPHQEPGSLSLRQLLQVNGSQLAVGEWIVRLRSDSSKVLAISSPHTLFAPRPAMDPTDGEEDWKSLWIQLGGAGDWRTADWGTATAYSLQKARAWADRLRGEYREGGAKPAWLAIFKGGVSTPGAYPGIGIEIYWGSGRRRVNLPSLKPSEWNIPPNSHKADRNELFDAVPMLASCEIGGVRYSRVDLRRTNTDTAVDAWWMQHLVHLSEQGKIAGFRRTAEGLDIGFSRDGVDYHASSPGAVVLVEREVFVSEIFALTDDNGVIRYPEVPLRKDFIDLLGHLQVLLDGVAYDKDEALSTQIGILLKTEGPDLHWELKLKGRTDVVHYRTKSKTPHSYQAHIAIWPRFRAENWRAYYAHDFFDNLYCYATMVWGDQNGYHSVDSSRRRQNENQPFPIRFEEHSLQKAIGVHQGAAPLAISIVRKLEDDIVELGMLLPRYCNIKSSGGIQLSIDFGTSNSTLAYLEAGSRQAKIVERRPAERLPAGDLDQHETLFPIRNTKLLEREPHKWLSRWFPANASGPQSTFNSELLFKDDSVNAALRRATLVPMTDYTIASSSLNRDATELVNRLAVDFKWSDTAISEEDAKRLQAAYLSLLLEQAVALICLEREAKPTSIALTFLHPLRATDLLSRFQPLVKDVVKAFEASTGIKATTAPFVDESRAARIVEGTQDALQIVADLGGGTLDLFLSADLPAIQIPALATSIRAGGNLLIQRLTRIGLPDSFGRDHKTAELTLRRWLRAKSMRDLVLPGTVVKRLDEEGSNKSVEGFRDDQQSEPVKAAISDYYHFLCRFIGRSVAAYVKHHAEPLHAASSTTRSAIRFSLQLRGNGWRGWYVCSNDAEVAAAVQRVVAAEVKERLLEAELLPLAWDPAKFDSLSAKTYPSTNAIQSPKQAGGEDFSGMLGIDLSERGTHQARPWHTLTPFAGNQKLLARGAVLPQIELARRQINEITGVALQQLNNKLLSTSVDEGKVSGTICADVWESLHELLEPRS